MRLFCFFCSLIAFFSLEAKQCTFIPPAGWEIAQLKNPSPYVQIGFLGKGNSDFRPSINLAIEEVDVSLKDYVKAVKALQSSDPAIQWRDLGRFAMQAGTGRLIEMTSTNAWGEVKILQAILVQDHKAYILTAAVQKSDFFSLQNEMLKSFRSLRLADQIWEMIPKSEERNHFCALFASLGQTLEKETEWKAVQREVAAHAELGAYWQFLALREAHEKIYKPESK